MPTPPRTIDWAWGGGGGRFLQVFSYYLGGGGHRQNKARPSANEGKVEDAVVFLLGPEEPRTVKNLSPRPALF